MKKYHDADWLEEMYVDRGLTYEEIGDICNVGRRTIGYHIRKHELNTKKYKYRDREWLEEMYVEKEYDTYEIADMCDTNQSSISRYLNKYNIDTRKNIGENHPYYDIDPTEHPQYGMRGEDSVNWKGGSSWRNGAKVSDWRRDVFERDDYTCKDCDTRGVELNAHHIDRWSEAPEKRFDIDNGVTLCINCHAQRHEDAGETNVASLIRYRL